MTTKYRLEDVFKPAQQACDSLLSQITQRPKVAIVLGSGLQVMEHLDGLEVVPFDHIEALPTATVKGHKGEVAVGQFAGVPVAVFKGRFHRYEGHPYQNVVFPITLMKLMGIQTVILTNSAGGLNCFFQAGDLMLIRDHIYWPYPCQEERGYLYLQAGPRFMPHYPERLLKLAINAGLASQVRLKEGVYCYMVGPSYEAHAELRMLQQLGGDAVGMSTVPEAMWAQAMGLDVLGISCVTNMTLDPVALSQTSHEEVIEVAQQSSERLQRLLQNLLPHL